MYTRRKRRCDLPLDVNDFQSFRARNSLGGLTNLSTCKQRLPAKPSNAHFNRPNKKRARPPRRATRYRAKQKYMPRTRQKQGIDRNGEHSA